MTYFKFIINTLFLIYGAVSLAQINQYHDDGTRHGVWEKMFEGTKQIRYSGTFDHGIEVGDFKFYTRGFTKQPTAIKTFSENGKKAEVRFYFQNGKLISKGIELNRKKEGKWEYYHNKRNDRLMMVEYYENGLLEGERLSYYESGAVSEKINFLHGKKQGKQLVYSVKGVLIKEFTFENDELNGANKFYSGKGVLIIEGIYKDDKKQGLWKYYDAQGNFTREKRYK